MWGWVMEVTSAFTSLLKYLLIMGTSAMGWHSSERDCRFLWHRNDRGSIEASWNFGLVWLGAKKCPVEHKAAGQPTVSTSIQERLLHIRGFEQIPRLKAKFLAFSIWHTQGFGWCRGRDDASFTDIFWHRHGVLVYIRGAILWCSCPTLCIQNSPAVPPRPAQAPLSPAPQWGPLCWNQHSRRMIWIQGVCLRVANCRTVGLIKADDAVGKAHSLLTASAGGSEAHHIKFPEHVKGRKVQWESQSCQQNFETSHCCCCVM